VNPRPAGPPTLRRHNLGLVLAALRAAGGASRAELAARTGLTRATVATLLEPLLGAGVLAEDAATPRGVGRPSRAVRFAAGGPVALGVAVDVDALAVCAVGLDGVVRAHRRLARDHRELGPDAVFDGAATLAVQVRGAVGARVLGVGLALPALLSTGSGAAHGADSALATADSAGADSAGADSAGADSAGADSAGADSAGADGATGRRACIDSPVVLRAPNLPLLDGSRPGAALAERLGCPVTVDNEATLGALAHLDLAPDLVYVSAGIGVGAGIVLDGRVYRGARGLAGELGHVVVDRDGPACGCGGRGCVERYAGTAALLADAGAADLDALVAALAGGDRRAAAATTRAAGALGAGLASVLNVLDVPVVVLGGTFARLASSVEPTLRAELAARALAPARVLASDHGDAAAVRGAAESVLDAVQRDPDRLLA
jgi:predicted NBD/HSP70 family sugar kinase